MTDIAKGSVLGSCTLRRRGLDKLLLSGRWYMQGRIHGTECGSGSTRGIGCISTDWLMGRLSTMVSGLVRLLKSAQVYANATFSGGGFQKTET